MPLTLEKLFTPATWRFLGALHLDLPFGSIPIGARSAKDIQTATGGTCFRIGRVEVRNAFVLALKGERRLLYVRPQYPAYAKAAKRVFAARVSYDVDFDHALARSIALRAAYNYVLLLRLPPHINRAHGSYEKLRMACPAADAVAFVDRRVLDKWLGRHPALFTGRRLDISYAPHARPDLGLTIQQRGRLAYALGWDEEPNLASLAPFQPA
jgi:hypothetical protein